MGGSTTMEKRGHHICKMVNYEVRQKVSKETSKRVGGSTYLCHNIKKECEISL